MEEPFPNQERFFLLYAIFKFCFDLFSIEWGHQTTVRRTLSRGFGGGRTIPQRLPRPPFSFVPSTARFLFGGTKRKCGVGTVGSKSCHVHAGKGRGNIHLKYAKRIPALCTNLFRRRLRRGTFHRRKVPKDRWGVSMRPRPLATPQAPEGSQHRAPRDAMI